MYPKSDARLRSITPISHMKPLYDSIASRGLLMLRFAAQSRADQRLMCPNPTVSALFRPGSGLQYQHHQICHAFALIFSIFLSKLRVNCGCFHGNM